MDEVYWNILLAAEGILQVVPILVPYKFDIRPSPTYVRDEDGGQITLVCPRRETWETVVDMQFGAPGQPATAFYGYPVLVALIVANAFDRSQLRWQINAREAVREAMFKATLTTAGQVYDVTYDPSPSPSSLSAFAPPVAVSLQLFTYTAQEQGVSP